MYLRGSLAKGTEVQGLSDVDTFALWLNPDGEVREDGENADSLAVQHMEQGVLARLEGGPTWQQYKGTWFTKVSTAHMILYLMLYCPQEDPVLQPIQLCACW